MGGKDWEIKHGKALANGIPSNPRTGNTARDAATPLDPRGGPRAGPERESEVGPPPSELEASTPSRRSFSLRSGAFFLRHGSQR